MAAPHQISRQERMLANAQRQLERIERVREQMLAEIEKQMRELERLQGKSEDFTNSSNTLPHTGLASPASFQSQFDQFDSTLSNKRLTYGNAPQIPDTGTGLIPRPTNETAVYRPGDYAEHYSTVMENPGKPLYASGRYIMSEHGSFAITEPKQYEYEVSTRALPLSVGDVVIAPVHPTGHNDGKAFTTNYLQMQITDLYTTPQFTPYHDRLE